MGVDSRLCGPVLAFISIDTKRASIGTDVSIHTTKRKISETPNDCELSLRDIHTLVVSGLVEGRKLSPF